MRLIPQTSLWIDRLACHALDACFGHTFRPPARAGHEHAVSRPAGSVHGGFMDRPLSTCLRRQLALGSIARREWLLHLLALQFTPIVSSEASEPDLPIRA